MAVKESPDKPDSTVKNVFVLLATIIGAVLFVRLLILIFNLAFNFSETALGRKVEEGWSFDVFSDISPRSIFIQTVIITVVVVVFALRKSKAKQNKK
jgi:hypothetical protein